MAHYDGTGSEIVY